MNDMFEISDQNDKLTLMYEENKDSFVSINTPFGQTSRKLIQNIEKQGSVLAPIKLTMKICFFTKESNLFHHYHSLMIWLHFLNVDMIQLKSIHI